VTNSKAGPPLFHTLVKAKLLPSNFRCDGCFRFDDLKSGAFRHSGSQAKFLPAIMAWLTNWIGIHGSDSFYERGYFVADPTISRDLRSGSRQR